MGRCRVRISPQLGHLPEAGGGPQRQRSREEPLSKCLKRGGTERGGEVEAGQDWRPLGVAGRGEGFSRLEGPSRARIRGEHG